MVLLSEVTTPEINLRWYLDISGLKRSKAYLINGVAIFLAWLVSFCRVLKHFSFILNMQNVLELNWIQILFL